PGRARYEVGAEIARGGMGRVVEAMDTLLGRTVAVKEALVESDEALRRFRREIYITARLEHPSIVPVHDAGTLPDGSMYYVMRKVTGRPLTELIAGAESLEQRLQLLPHVVAAAQALGHAHHRGVIHRDIKPSNILVGELGETVVIDWGLAKVIGEPDDGPEAPVPVDAGASLRTRFGVVFGTPGFMAPEQARGEKVDARSDVYALGATLYYTFTRQPPHARASETEMMVAVASAPAQPIGEVVVGLPRELSTIVDKCLAYDDRARYADAAELAADLQRFVSGQLVASHEYSRRERLARFVRKNKLAVGVATIALLTLAIGGAIAVRGIVSARDRADQQAALATQRQHDAEVSRGKEAERADQLLITQAGVLAAQNPTAAVALLKQLTQPAERWQRLWRQARAIASSARFNGVVRAIPADGYITELRLSPAASRAASIDTDGNIWVYDLGAETRKQLDSNGRNFGMTFLDDDELVMFRDKLARFTNVVTGETRDHTFGFTIRELFGAPGLVLAQDVDYKLHRVDPTTFAETTYAIPEVLDVAIARDNSKVAVCSARGTFVIDVKTNVATKLGDKPGHSAHWDRDSKYLAVAGGHETNLYTFDGKPPTHHAFPKQIVLDLGVTTKGVVYYNLSAGYFRDRGPGTEVLPLTFELTQTTDSGVGIHVLGETALVPRGDAIQVYDAYKSYTLHSPAGPINHLVTREGLRVVAHTTGHLLVWDLAEHYP
ncbi:MAG TPA: serine/threonine-protein kinase, partial [Kofleriaceae bacterium]